MRRVIKVRGYGSTLIPFGLRVLSLAIQYDSRRRMVGRVRVLIVSIAVMFKQLRLWPGRLKCVVYGSCLDCMVLYFLISERVLLRRVYSVVSVFPMYCFLQSVHVSR